MAQLKRNCLRIAENANSVSGFEQEPLRAGALGVAMIPQGIMGSSSIGSASSGRINDSVEPESAKLSLLKNI